MSRWPRRIAVLGLGMALSFGLLIQGARPASACSCAMPNPVSGLANADGAFVGTLVDKEELGEVFNSGDTIDFTFQVDTALKGDIGDTIVVKSAADGAACGIETPIGTEAGYLLTRNGANWEGNLCATLPADVLLDAAVGLPAPVAGSPPHLIVSIDLGATGLMALDLDGNTVGYGAGPFPWLLSACPDDRSFAGLGSDNTIRTWSYSDLSVVSETPLPEETGVIDLLCGGPEGDPIYYVEQSPDGYASWLARVSNGGTEVIQEDIERMVTSTSGPIAIGSDGVVYRLDPATGALEAATTPLANIDGQVVAMVPSPDGTHLALATLDWSRSVPEGHLFLIDMTDGGAAAVDVDCDLYPTWLDNERVQVLSSCSSSEPQVYDTDLNPIGPGESSEQYWSIGAPVDEEGRVFYGGGYSVRFWDPGTGTDSEFASLLTYPASMLVVPESTRAEWVGSTYVPPPVTDAPPTTIEAAPPVEPPPTSDAPPWLVLLALVSTVGVLGLLFFTGPQTGQG